jgi:kynurenine 3-monooxygenase
MALENYITMRDSVRDRRFLLRKSLEHELERRYSECFIGRYSMVMFHRMPYTETYRRGEIQAGILDQLLLEVAQLEQVDFQLAGRLIHERLSTI